MSAMMVPRELNMPAAYAPLRASSERPFRRVAEAVVEKLTDLLAARVAVVARGVVVAGQHSDRVGRPFEPALDVGEVLLTLPLSVAGQTGEVVVGDSLSGEAISPRLAQGVVELVINQTAVLDRLPQQQELKNTFIHNLLHGLLHDEEDILRQARLLGLDMTPPRAVILIDAADYILRQGGDGVSEDEVRRRAQHVIGSVVDFFHLPNDLICAYIGQGEVAVLKASNTRNLVVWAENQETAETINPSWANLTALKRAGSALLKRLRSDMGCAISVGIGRYHPGVTGLARSYDDEVAELSLGRRFHGQNGVHCLDALGIPAFVAVADEQTKVDLATYLLSPLDHAPELIDTLNAFFAADCSASLTAERLCIHRNTLTYRLEKISSLTGLDPRCFDDAVQIRLALVLRALRAH